MENTDKEKAKNPCAHKGEWQHAGQSALTPATGEFTIIFVSLYCKNCAEVVVKTSMINLPKLPKPSTIAVPEIKLTKN